MHGLPLALTALLLSLGAASCTDHAAPPYTTEDRDVSSGIVDVSSNDDQDGEVEDLDAASGDGQLQDPDAADADGDDVDVCVCSEMGPCCDGCHAVNVGEGCDLGLNCVINEVCTEQGICEGVSPCDVANPEPDCRLASCDEVMGCSYVDMREGFECEFLGAPIPGTCVEGECTAPPCQCSEGLCCDGCFFMTAEEVCFVGEHELCDDEFTCPGHYKRYAVEVMCSGVSSVCNGERTVLNQVGNVRTCPSYSHCEPRIVEGDEPIEMTDCISGC